MNNIVKKGYILFELVLYMSLFLLLTVSVYSLAEKTLISNNEIQDFIAYDYKFQSDKYFIESLISNDNTVKGSVNVSLDSIYYTLEKLDIDIKVPRKIIETGKIYFEKNSENNCGKLKLNKKIENFNYNGNNIFLPSSALTTYGINVFSENVADFSCEEVSGNIQIKISYKTNSGKSRTYEFSVKKI